MSSRGGLVLKTICDGAKLVQSWNLYQSLLCMTMPIVSQFPRILWYTHGPKSGKTIKDGAKRGSQPQPSSRYHVRVGTLFNLSSTPSNLTCEPV